MFRGNHPARVDEKGRLKVPAVHKSWIDEAYAGQDGAAAQFYITSRDGGRAEIYPMKVWERIEAELMNAPSSEAKSRFEDAVNYYGQVIEMDAQGRLLIPQKLRERADLKGEVAVIGQRERLDVVNDERFAGRLQAHPFGGADATALGIRGI